MNTLIYYCTWTGENKPDSHTLLREVLSRYLRHQPSAADGSDPKNPPADDSPSALSLTVCRDGAHGKPYVKEYPDVHFSISHSGSFWACAVSGSPVGLDLQKEEKKERFAGIAGRFFHPEEITFLQAGDYADFTRIWAKKESYVKYTGDGLTKGLDYFSVLHPEALDIVQQEIDFVADYCMAITTKEACTIHLIPLMERQ